MQVTCASLEPDPARFHKKNTRKAIFLTEKCISLLLLLLSFLYNRNDNWLPERNALVAFTGILNGLQSLVIVIQL